MIAKDQDKGKSKQRQVSRWGDVDKRRERGLDFSPLKERKVEMVQAPINLKGLESVAPLLGKINPLELVQLVMNFIGLYMAGADVKIHAIFQVKEKKFSVCIYEGEKQVLCSTLVDM